MNSIQMGKAASPPDSLGPKVFFSSKPSHTPQVMEGEKPTNQASVKSLVVPVFPATGCLSVSAAVAVPIFTTPSSSETMVRAVCTEITSFTSGKFSSRTRPS